MLNPPYRESQQYHPHEAHLAAFQQAFSSFSHSHLSQRESAAGNLQLLSNRATFKTPLEFPSSTSGGSQSGDQTVNSLGCRTLDTCTHGCTCIHIAIKTLRPAAQGQLPKHTYSMGLLLSTTTVFVHAYLCEYMMWVCTNPQIEFYWHGVTIIHVFFKLF